MSSSQEASLSSAQQALTTGGTAFYRYGIWLLLLVTLVSRLPFVASEPYGWDSFNYLLSVDSWRPGEDIPQFPGYMYHVLGLQALRLLIQGDALDVLHASSLLYTLLAIYLLHRFARSILAERIGLNLQEAELFAMFAATMLAFNPMVWHFSEIGLAYSGTVCVSVVGAWLILWDKRSLWYWSIAAFCIAWIGGWRPESIFLTPLLFWGMISDHARLKHWLAAFLAFCVGGFLWFLPALIVSGQGWEYVTGGFHELSFSRYILTQQGGGWLQYRLHRLVQASGWLVFSFGFAPVALLPRVSVVYSAWKDLSREIRLFFLFWGAIPAIPLFATFYGGHFIFLVPSFTLLTALLLVYTARSSWQAWSSVGIVLFVSVLWFTHPWEHYSIAPPYTASRIEANDIELNAWRDAIINLDPTGTSPIVCFGGQYPWRGAMVDFPTLPSIQVLHASPQEIVVTVAQKKRETASFRTSPPLPDSLFQGSDRLLVIGLIPDDASQRGTALSDLAGFSPSDSLRVGQEWVYAVSKVGSSNDEEQ